MSISNVAIVGQLAGNPNKNVLEGPRRQTYYFAKELGSRPNIKVTVFTERYDGSYRYEDEPFEVVAISLDRPYIPVRLCQNYIFSARVLAAVIRNDFDIIHLHRFYTYPLDLFGTYVLTMIGAETRQEVGDIDSAWEYAGDRINSFLQKRLLDSVDGSTAISPRLNDEIKEFWDREVDEVLPLGIGDKFLAESDRSPPDSDAVLYVSRISRKKDQEYLLEHLNYKSIDLRLVGGVHERKYYESLIDRYEGSEDLFQGFVPDDELLNEYRNARVYVLPSQHENFGFTGLEAMASGTPVLLRDTIGLAGFLDSKGADGAIVFSNPAELRDALERLLSDDKCWQEVSHNARRTAHELRWSKVVDKYVNFYQKTNK